MPRVIIEACVRCKYMDCVEACPVDAFREGKNMLVIGVTGPARSTHEVQEITPDLCWGPTLTGRPRHHQ